MSSYLEKGIKAPKEWFTGNVWLNINVKPEEGYNTNIGTVTFEPKARTNWHKHISGQILFVIDGIGYYQEQGDKIKVIKQGDVIKIPKDVKHWHGASHQSEMRHIAMITDFDKDETKWLEIVNDDEYNQFKSPIYDVENNISIKAIMNHEELWPNYVSTVKDSDPDLIEVFDNFAFDEIIDNSKIDVKLRTLIIIASTIGSQSLTEFKMFVNAALNIEISTIEIKEIVYQSVPYVGISKVIDFVHATNAIFRERNIELNIDSQSTTNFSNRLEKGLAVQKYIFGDTVNEMYKNSPKDLLHIQEYLSANCFGDYVSRNGLEINVRELLTLSFLIALGGTENQIKGHIQGNINIGNDRELLIDMMTQLIPYVGYPRVLNAINCLNEIIPSKQ